MQGSAGQIPGAIWVFSKCNDVFQVERSLCVIDRIPLSQDVSEHGSGGDLSDSPGTDTRSGTFIALILQGMRRQESWEWPKGLIVRYDQHEEEYPKRCCGLPSDGFARCENVSILRIHHREDLLRWSRLRSTISVMCTGVYIGPAPP